MKPTRRARLREIMARKPSMAQIARVNAALATPGVAVCHERGERHGWTYDVYDSAFYPGRVHVNAERRGEQRCETVADLAAAHMWLLELPA